MNWNSPTSSTVSKSLRTAEASPTTTTIEGWPASFRAAWEHDPDWLLGIGYDYLVDEQGLRLQPIEPGRDYVG